MYCYATFNLFLPEVSGFERLESYFRYEHICSNHSLQQLSARVLSPVCSPYEIHSHSVSQVKSMC